MMYYTLEAIGKAAIADGLDAKLVGSSLAFYAKHSGGLHSLPPEGNWRDQLARDVLLANMRKIGADQEIANTVMKAADAAGQTFNDFLSADAYAFADAMMKARQA